MPIKPGGATDPAARIERLVQSQDRLIRRAFEEAVRAIASRHTLEEIATLLGEGRVTDALDELEAAARRLAGRVNQSFVEAANRASDFLNGALTVTVSFDQVNERAVAIMQDNRLRLVNAFTEEQQRATRAALEAGMREGVNPREMARRFRSSIGLTERQQRAVDNYRRLLRGGRAEALARELRDRRFDSTIARALRGEAELTDAQIERMTARYRERYLKFRAETIARTESLRAVNEGTQEMYQQAFDEGVLSPDEVKRTWVTAGDERVRTSHAFLDGQARAPGEPFETGLGQLMFPGDPSAPPAETVNCRCALATRLEPLQASLGLAA